MRREELLGMAVFWAVMTAFVVATIAGCVVLGSLLAALVEKL